MSNDIIMRIEGGHVINKTPVQKFFNELSDGSYLVIFRPRKIRSDNQHRYYWVCISLVLDGLREIGYDEIRDKNDAHELMKQMFLKRRIVNHDTGEVMGELSRSTTELSKDEMIEYIDRIGQFCAEYLGFALPPPNTQLKIIQ